MPPAALNRDKQIVLILMINDNRIGPGPIGDFLVQLLEIIPIANVHRVAIRTGGRLLLGLSNRPPRIDYQKK